MQTVNSTPPSQKKSRNRLTRSVSVWAIDFFWYNQSYPSIAFPLSIKLGFPATSLRYRRPLHLSSYQFFQICYSTLVLCRFGPRILLDRPTIYVLMVVLRVPSRYGSVPFWLRRSFFCRRCIWRDVTQDLPWICGINDNITDER